MSHTRFSTSTDNTKQKLTNQKQTKKNGQSIKTLKVMNPADILQCTLVQCTLTEVNCSPHHTFLPRNGTPLPAHRRSGNASGQVLLKDEQNTVTAWTDGPWSISSYVQRNSQNKYFWLLPPVCQSILGRKLQQQYNFFGVGKRFGNLFLHPVNHDGGYIKEEKGLYRNWYPLTHVLFCLKVIQ